jgi:hypothetical protein
MNTARNRGILGILCCLLAFFVLELTGCGSPSPQQGFIWSGVDGVAFLTWANQNGQVSGTYSAETREGGQVSGLPVTGQQQDETHVSLRIPNMAQVTGTITGSTMKTTDATGDTVIWYAGTSQQYDQIQTAFQAFATVQDDLNTVLAVKVAPPDDSSPAYYQTAFQKAQDRVKKEQAFLDALEQQSDPLTLCSGLQEFSLDFPPANRDSVLQLPFWQPGDQGPQAVVDRSDLAETVTHLSNDAKRAANLTLPDIQGLPLPWKVNPQPSLRQGQQQLETLKSVVFAVAPQFPPLRAQAQQIQAQEATIKQAHQCFG